MRCTTSSVKKNSDRQCRTLPTGPAALDGPPVPARYYFPEDIEVWVSDKLLEPDDATVKEYFFDHYQGRIAIKDFKTGAISYEVPALPHLQVQVRWGVLSQVAAKLVEGGTGGAGGRLYALVGLIPLPFGVTPRPEE